MKLIKKITYNPQNMAETDKVNRVSPQYHTCRKSNSKTFTWIPSRSAFISPKHSSLPVFQEICPKERHRQDSCLNFCAMWDYHRVQQTWLGIFMKTIALLVCTSSTGTCSRVACLLSNTTAVSVIQEDCSHQREEACSFQKQGRPSLTRAALLISQ